MRRDVLLRVRTGLPHRLLRRAMDAGIHAGEARVEDGCLWLCLSPADARAMVRLCADCGLRAETVSLRGGGALSAFLRRRATLLAAAVAFIAVTALLLGRIWRVDIAFTGSVPERGEESVVRAALAELGIWPGSSANVDLARLSGALEARLPDYSYVNVRRQGMRLLVSAAPEVPAPGLYALDAARDLCAREDGVVLSVNVRAGEPCVSPGDTVRRGQLLIRGEERDRGDAVRSIAALGEVIVRTWATGSASLPREVWREVPTGRVARDARLVLPGLEVPMEAGEAFAEQTVETERVPIGGLFLPLEIRRALRHEVVRKAVAADETWLRTRAAAMALAEARAALGQREEGSYAIARQWLEYDGGSDGTFLRARAVIEITTDTAVTRDTLYLGGYAIWKAWNTPTLPTCTWIPPSSSSGCSASTKRTSPCSDRSWGSRSTPTAGTWRSPATRTRWSWRS